MERRLAAILAADVVGFSRLMGADEAGTLEQFRKLRADCIDQRVAEHHGRIFKLTGDGFLAEFPSVVGAVACAAEMQGELRAQAGAMQFRMGVNLGDVIAEEGDVYGDGVNLAVRLESVALPGGIAVSDAVQAQVGTRLAVRFTDRGEQHLKNIERPIHVFDVVLNEVPGDAPATREDCPSVAVLPFTNMSGDPEQEYFSDGITEDIVTDLSKISALFVASRNSSFVYKGKAANVQQVGHDLGVGFVLEGSVRKAGTRVRVTAQLVDAKSGGHLWAERFDRDLTDIFAIQDEITHAIVEQLKVKLLPQERQSIAQTQTENFEAYSYYLRGREFWRRETKHYLQLARRMFLKAVELDPNYARAYAGIADCDSLLIYYYRQDIAIDSILAMTEKALSFDDALAEAHGSRGFALSLAQRREEAVAEFERAIALDPNSFEAHLFYGRASFAQGKTEQALALFERAGEIRPDDLTVQTTLTHIYRSLGRDLERREAARRTIEIAERELSLHPEDARPLYMGIEGLIELGETERAREWISRALALEPDDPTAQYNLACGYTKLGDLDLAFDLLERSLPQANVEMKKWMRRDSDLDGLRSHPRYPKLLALIGEPR